jgi:hypothetical protein
MPLTPTQIDRLTRSYQTLEPNLDIVTRRFEANLRARGQSPSPRATACVDELRALIRSAARTDGLGIPSAVKNRAGWGAEEYALLEAIREQCGYTWTERLEADWAVLVSFAVERALASAAA